MTTFYLIRHGAKQSDGLMVGRLPGVHLTAAGRRQAQALATHLRGEKISHVLSSPLERAVETAEPLARVRGLAVESALAFHELDMGDWTGRAMRTLAAQASWKRFCHFPAGNAIPGGETLAEAQGRVVGEIIRLRGAHPDTGIAIVTHEDPIRLALCHFVGAPINVYDKISIRLGSVTVLQLDTHRVLLDRVNEVPPARRTGRVR